MPIVVDPFLLDHMAAHSGACTFVLKEVADGTRAVAGMQAARRAVGAIPHPEEPEDPLPSWMSSVVETEHGARFTVDVADAEAYEGLLEQVLNAVVDALAGTGVETGLLTFDLPDGGRSAPAMPPEKPARLTFRPSTLGVPIPNPHQFLWGSRDGAGYFLPHDPEQLMSFYEAQRGVILSIEVATSDEPAYGLVISVVGGVLITVRVRDAGDARNLEISVDRDRAVIEHAVARLRTEPLPEGTRIRVDRR